MRALRSVTVGSGVRCYYNVLLRRGYHERVVDHYNNPRNVGTLNKDDPSVGTGLVGAPACGDVMRFVPPTPSPSLSSASAFCFFLLLLLCCSVSGDR